MKMIKSVLDKDSLSKEVRNNVKLLKAIIEKHARIKDYSAFYCILPIQIEEISLDAKNLNDRSTPEKLKVLTDIDLFVALFNENKFEFYLVEGKNKSKGFKRAVEEDFESKIKLNFNFPNLIQNIVYEENEGRGGFVKITN